MIKTVGIFGKYQDASIENFLKVLAKHIEAKGIIVKIGYTTAAEITRDLPNEKIDEQLPIDIDLAIVIGGDGTLLHVARRMGQAGIPIAGVNLGRVGFLTDIPQSSMLLEIDNILAGGFHKEDRMMLDVKILSKDKNNTVYHQTALNDVVLGRHALEKLLHWEAYVNGDFVLSSRSDGVILSTPTGSTAYSLSAGGVIMHPKVNIISMVPISPHTLSNRPIGLPGDAVIDVTISDKADSAHVSCDGLIGYKLKGNETIRITQSKHVATLVHTENYNYFKTLRTKLGWGATQ